MKKAMKRRQSIAKGAHGVAKGINLTFTPKKE
jgi:hypothetical protein